MFATVVHNLKSPENVGIIVRTHVAFGGRKFVVVGPEPWRFKKSTQAFSRHLEALCDIVYLPGDPEFFAWCGSEGFTPVALEISQCAEFFPEFVFPENSAIIVGNEGVGLSEGFLSKCVHVVTIPQFGPVECLNAAVSCCMAIYELNRNRPPNLLIDGTKFKVSPF